jgi:hypothetical protein
LLARPASALPSRSSVGEEHRRTPEVGRPPAHASYESFGSSTVMPSFHQYMQVLHSDPGAPGGN